LDATALQSLLQSAESLDVPAPSSRPGSRSISRTPSSDQLSGMTQPSIEAFSFGIAAPSDTKVFEAPTSQRRDPRLSYENVGKLERELRRAQASAAKLSAQVTSLGGVPAANVSDASVDVVSADVLALKLKIESLESELRSASEKATVQPVEVVQQLPITDNSDAIISALKQQISELEQSAATHNSQSQQAAELQAEINALQSELKDKQQRVTQFESEVRSLEMQMKQDDKSQVLIELNASLSTMQSQLIALQSQLNESHARSEQLESSLQAQYSLNALFALSGSYTFFLVLFCFSVGESCNSHGQ
jgi:predicted RNase H-like nuclease (RuvC/YqgF family)